MFPFVPRWTSNPIHPIPVVGRLAPVAASTWEIRQKRAARPLPGRSVRDARSKKRTRSLRCNWVDAASIAISFQVALHALPAPSSFAVRARPVFCAFLVRDVRFFWEKRAENFSERHSVGRVKSRDFAHARLTSVFRKGSFVHKRAACSLGEQAARHRNELMARPPRRVSQKIPVTTAPDRTLSH